MIININNKKLLFIHIPKTGGTSIEKAFSKVDLKWPDFHKNILWGRGPRGLEYQHLTMKQVFQLTDYCVSDFDGIFTIVREPFSRFLSLCNWRRDSPDLMIQYIKSNTYCHNLSQYDYIEGYENSIKIYRFEDGIDTIIDKIIRDYDLDVTVNIVPHCFKSNNTVKLSDEIKNNLREKLSIDFEKFHY
tara:strand:- start:4782 stop:5345 length:564 start_codon:yes stop_codon:yes gene_type:complete